MKPHYETDFGILHEGNCNDILPPIPDNLFTGIVTDPPYGLEFMGKTWDKLNLHNSPEAHGKYPKSRNVRGVKYGEADGFKQQQWHYIWAKEALRVVKPGAFLLAFGGTRTHHRLMCAIEDAGWEIRDCMMWLYGSGFPKSLDISKAIDKAAGAEREVVGKGTSGEAFKLSGENPRPWHENYKNEEGRIEFDITKPATPEAQEWDGYGTALKPAWEPIIVAMKPLNGTFAENALNHGVAGLNIDKSRIGTVDKTQRINKGVEWGNRKEKYYEDRTPELFGSSQGRFPANIILTHHPECEMVGVKKVKAITGGGGIKAPGKNEIYGNFEGKEYPEIITKGDPDGTETVESWNCHENCPVGILDEQSGERKAGGKVRGTEPSRTGQNDIYGIWNRVENFPHNDTGTASRFFYTAKASRSERGKDNKHPTVKPLALIKYLVELIAPPKDALILDMFFGSGTLGVVCEKLRIKYVGIDLDLQYAVPRIKKATKQLKLFT